MLKSGTYGNTADLLFKEICLYIDNQYDFLYNLAIDICKIPSMTDNEGQKAEFVLNKLKEIGAESAYIDEAGNVIYLYDSGETNPSGTMVNNKPNSKLSIFAAHIDTVFKNIWDINPTIKEDKIYAPSVLDNSVNVAGLIFCIKILRELNVSIEKPILFAFDVGEEGLGNLKGIKHITDEWKGSIDEVIALDLGYKAIVDTAVGSRRYSVTIETEGGHSWGAFGNDNAILYTAKIVNDIYKIQVPVSPKTTYNVGIIKGGTSINTIAENATIEVDLRSIDKTCLEQLYQNFVKIIENYKSDKVKISVRTLGERPCGTTPHDSSLIERVINTRDELGLKTEFRASSTDANYPMSLGIPSISFGIGDGMGVHTQDEYLIAESMKTGMKHLLRFILKYNEE
mgnify:CR=1 FL=1